MTGELARELYQAFCRVELREKNLAHPLWAHLRDDLKAIFVEAAEKVQVEYERIV